MLMIHRFKPPSSWALPGCPRSSAWIMGFFLLAALGCTHRRGSGTDDAFSCRDAGCASTREPIFACSSPKTTPDAAMASLPVAPTSSAQLWLPEAPSSRARSALVPGARLGSPQVDDFKAPAPLLTQPEQGPPKRLPAPDIVLESAVANSNVRVVADAQMEAVPPIQLPVRGIGPRPALEASDMRVVAEKQPQFPLPQVAGARDRDNFLVATVRPETTLDLVVGLPQILVLKDAPKRIQMEGNGIAAYTVITAKELSIVGKKPGRTVLNLWFADPKDVASDRVVSCLVQVREDPQTQLRGRERWEEYCLDVEREINNAFPNCVVRLRVVGSQLVVSGQARHIAEASQILQIVARHGGGETLVSRAGFTVVDQGPPVAFAAAAPVSDP
jgi:hypothetical protein